MAGPSNFRFDENADKASFEASVKTRILEIVDELIPQIRFPAPPTGRKPWEDPGASALFFRMFLRAALARGNPPFADFALRANGFFAELAELGLDPSPYLDDIQELGQRLIEVEALQKMRAELIPSSDAAPARSSAQAPSDRAVEMDNFLAEVQRERAGVLAFVVNQLLLF